MSLSRGQFQAEINHIEKLLQKIDFLEERNYYPNLDFDPSEYRKKGFVDNWKSLISDNIYTFLLTDNSILNFKWIDGESQISFTFYECPYNCQTYLEFLQENDLEHDYENKIFEDYYQVYLFQCSFKENPITIRYDLDFNSYMSGVHPASHIHIGHKNQVRIGLDKILNPKSFVSFILRQHYPAVWKTIIESNSEWKTYFIKEKSLLTKVNETNWKELDFSEFFLS